MIGVDALIISGFVFKVMNYSEKLKSPKWQKKRLEILQRDNFTCQLCTDTETELHIHHLKYTGEPHEAPDDDLQTLCKVCHEFESLLHKKGEELIFVQKLNNNFFGKLKSGKITIGWYNKNNSKYFSIIIDQPEKFKEIVNILIK